MNIVLYSSFEKKENSTKRPTSQQSSITLSGYLREPCSMISPVFAIERLNPDISPSQYTYAYISEYRRYYFVRDWTWRGGLWQCELEVDVLATFKTEIGNTTQYILRTNSNTSNFNPLITDVMYPATNDYTTYETVLPGNWAVSISTGTYIVGIISAEDTGAVGAVSYYAMDSTQFGALKDMLFSDQNLYQMGITNALGQLAINDMSKEIFKTMYNPYQYIVSCMWFPLSISQILPNATMQTTLKIGWWEYGLQNYPVFAQQISLLGAETTHIQAHPQASTRGDYLNYEPYTSIVIYGRFGTVVIDNSKLKAGWLLNFSYHIDLITGQCRVEINTWDDNEQLPEQVTLAERYFLIGVPIQLSQVGVDYLGASMATVDTVAGVMRGVRYADAGLALSSVAHGLYNTIQSKMPIVETSGANGSFLTPYKLTRVTYHYYEIVDEDIEHKGRPLCELRVINTLSGYTLCADGEIEISCLNEERQKINRYLTTGFFWE